MRLSFSVSAFKQTHGSVVGDTHPLHLPPSTKPSRTTLADTSALFELAKPKPLHSSRVVEIQQRLVELQEHQRPPEGYWDIWIFKGGRGTGKTVAGAHKVIEHLREFGTRARVGIMAPTQGDVVATCAEGETGLITTYRSEFLRYNRATQLGAEAYHYMGGYVRFMGSEKPGRWNGPQWTMLWIDEAELCKPESIEQADFGCRLGDHPFQVWTTTPKASRYVKRVQSQEGVVVTRAGTQDNRYLAERVRARYYRRYAGTSLEKSQLQGIDLDVPEGAIWPMLGEFRELYLHPFPGLFHMDYNPDGVVVVRVLVGIDWGTTEQHIASMPLIFVCQDGSMWVRRWYRSASGSSEQLVEQLKAWKEEFPDLSAAAIDRSQWSLADWVEKCKVVALKGDREVEWRNGLVYGLLEKHNLHFDSTDPDVREAYDFLVAYHTFDEHHTRAGEVEEKEDDDADSLAYGVAEALHPAMGLMIGSVEHKEPSPADRKRVSPYRFKDTPSAPPAALTREGSSYGLPGRSGR